VEEIEAALQPPSRRWMLATAAAVVLAVVTGVVAYERAKAPETVRLTIAPVRSEAATNGLLKAAAGRLRGVKSNKMRLEVIPPGGQGRKATHVLTVDTQPDKGGMLVRANLSDAGSLLLKKWQAEYESSELRYLPLALPGVVTGALHVPPVDVPQTVNAAAAADFAKGVALAQRNDRLDAAIPRLEKAVAADWDSPLTHARLAEALLLKYNDTLNSAWLERATVSLENAEKRNPDVALVRLVAGMRSEYTKSFAAAEADLQRARELDPRNGDVWRHLGGVYVGSNRLAEAEIAYKKAIELEPEYYRNYHELCRYYGDHGNYEEAVRQCQKAIALAPDLAEEHFMLARVHGTRGRYRESEREAREALKLDPTSSKILQMLAFTLGSEGRYENAIPFLERAINVGSASDLAYLNLGSAYRLANYPEKAQEAYRKAASLAREGLAQNLNNGLVRSHLAYVSARLGDRQDAEYEADQAWQLAPGSVDVAQNLVMAYEALNERQRTLDFVSKAPEEALRRVKYDGQADLADLHNDPRFQQLLELHHIQ
jgi:tetratricopeptide (TPR) repeat protein